ncbi:MAG: adenosylcobinamide-GDP ribazoletransferase [Deltaproteobacteria bacterium]|nr:adenosylcobinamide-GDP ribazoletransferase [Deltaproteobacteria bacterium]
MKGLFLAIQLLTIIPVKFIGKAEPSELGRSTAFFPIVGAIQGLILVISNMLLSKILPHGLADGLLLVVLILTNGGFHLDGFADTIDGIAGGNTKEEKLKIMRDSQIGAIGVAALVLLILIKFIAINNLPVESKNAVLFLLPVFGRWAIVPMAYLSNYAREGEGLGKAFTEHTGKKEVIIAALFTILFSSVLLGKIGLVYIGIVLLFTYLVTLYFKRSIGGVTGDVFGFHSELTEVLFLIMVLSIFAV